jgi:hypothetical protein
MSGCLELPVIKKGASERQPQAFALPGGKSGKLVCAVPCSSEAARYPVGAFPAA